MSTFIFGDDWKLNLARGKLRNASHVHKFGRNSSLANGSEETIWDGSNLYPWSAWNAGADNVYLKSSSASDASITIFIQGLDENYALQSEVVTLDGTDPSATAVASANTYVRLFRMYNTSATPLTGNVSALYASDSGTMVAQVRAGFDQTLMSVYTIPAGHVGYLLNLNMSTPKNAEVDGRLYFRNFGGVFRIQHSGNMYGSSYNMDFQIPLAIPGKTDIDLRAQASSSGINVAGHYDIVIVQDNEFSLWSPGY